MLTLTRGAKSAAGKQRPAPPRSPPPPPPLPPPAAKTPSPERPVLIKSRRQRAQKAKIRRRPAELRPKRSLSPAESKAAAQSRPAPETSALGRPPKIKKTRRHGGRLVEPRPPAKTDPSEEKPSPFRTSAADAGDDFVTGTSPPNGRVIERAHRIPDANSSPFSATPAAQLAHDATSSEALSTSGLGAADFRCFN